jgi:hypothetical protein
VLSHRAPNELCPSLTSSSYSETGICRPSAYLGKQLGELVGQVLPSFPHSARKARKTGSEKAKDAEVRGPSGGQRGYFFSSLQFALRPADMLGGVLPAEGIGARS